MIAIMYLQLACFAVASSLFVALVAGKILEKNA